MRLAVCLIVCLTLDCSAATAQTVGWRTDGTGAYPQAKPVTKWGPATNVIWKTPMPGKSNATPVRVGDKIFVCADPATLICVNAADGKILWQADNGYEKALTKAQADAMKKEMTQKAKEAAAKIQAIEKEIAELKKEAGNARKIRTLERQLRNLRRSAGGGDPFAVPRTHPANGHATPTPVTDGKHVFVVFGLGIAAAYDLDGNRVWSTFLGKPSHGWGHSASPALAGGKLVIHFGKLRGLDPKTGKESWSVDSREHWGSPVATKIGNTDVILTTNGEAVRASDGKVLADDLPQLAYAAPVVVDGVAYYAERKTTAAIQLPDEINGEFKTLWRLNNRIKGSRHYASPVIHDGLLYCISREEDYTVIDAKTGDVLQEASNFLGNRGGQNSAYPSISLGGKHLFVSNEKGTTAVVELGKGEAKIVSTNKLDGFRSSPVFDGSRLYLRTFSHLYCIGKAQ